jgi:hypothetical protein
MNIWNNHKSSFARPKGRGLVKVVRSTIVAVAPIPVSALAVRWRLVELIFGKFDAVSSGAGEASIVNEGESEWISANIWKLLMPTASTLAL